MKSDLTNPVLAASTADFEKFQKGSLQPITLSEQQWRSVGLKSVYILDCRKSNKSIPVE
jgi:hypothetical protein